MINIPVIELPFEFIPKADWVVIEPAEDPEVKRSRLIIPGVDPNGVSFIWGKVLAVGEGSMTIDGGISPPSVSVGEYVWFAHSPGVWYRKEGKPIVVVQEQYLWMAVSGPDFLSLSDS